MFVAYSTPLQSGEPRILAACPPGEWHEIGLLMVCLFLARRGVDLLVITLAEPHDPLTELRQTSRARWGIETP